MKEAGQEPGGQALESQKCSYYCNQYNTSLQGGAKGDNNPLKKLGRSAKGALDLLRGCLAARAGRAARRLGGAVRDSGRAPRPSNFRANLRNSRGVPILASVARPISQNRNTFRPRTVKMVKARRGARATQRFE